jgi:hypothetical protein
VALVIRQGLSAGAIALAFAAGAAGCGGDDGNDSSPAGLAGSIESCLEDAGLQATTLEVTSLEPEDVQAGAKAQVRAVSPDSGVAEEVNVFDDAAAATAWVNAKKKADAGSAGPDIVEYAAYGKTGVELFKSGTSKSKVPACAEKNGG